MDNTYLTQLIDEANSRGGGLILNLDNQPAAVVLSVEKYNQLLNQAQTAPTVPKPQSAAVTKTFMKNQNILVTGGAGYIGSHAARQLLENGYQVTIIDNLSTGKRHNVPEKAKFVEGDLADSALLRDLFAQEKFFGVMHFAASIEVEESVSKPVEYLENNTINTANLLSVMAEFGVKRLIFSSTASVYGQPDKPLIDESTKPAPMNPYGYSKLVSERVIKFYCQFVGFRAVVFRYFNACGCDFEGDVEPTHHSHLMDNIMQVATGHKNAITVFGEDYPTFDGTCIRDYVHVLDIAKAHLAALPKIEEGEAFRVFNIGTGKGVSVLEMVNKTSELINKIIPMEKGPRRAGDPTALVADNKKLTQELGYHLQFSSLDSIIQTSWKQAQNFS